MKCFIDRNTRNYLAADFQQKKMSAHDREWALHPSPLPFQDAISISAGPVLPQEVLPP